MKNDWQSELLHCAKVLAIACIICCIAGLCVGCKSQKSVTTDTHSSSVKNVRSDSLRVDGLFSLSNLVAESSADSSIVEFSADSIIADGIVMYNVAIGIKKKNAVVKKSNIIANDAVTLFSVVTAEKDSAVIDVSHFEKSVVAPASSSLKWWLMALGIVFIAASLFARKRLNL